MKKLLAVILAALMLLTMSAVAFAAEGNTSYGAYKHVYIIGVDGAGASYSKCETPNFDRIFANGAVKYNAQTEYISTSAQNWGAILTGVSYLKHGLTNEICDEVERDSTTNNKSIFYYVRQQMPDAELVSFNNWSAINHGIIENDINVNKINCGDDDSVVAAICDYFDAGNLPTMMFVQLDSVDHAGHTYGGQSQEYYDAAENSDNYIGAIYDSLEKNGALEDALFMVVADHGEKNGGGHGGQSLEESSAFLALVGKTVSNSTLPDGTRNRDVAAIALYALGVEEPAHMTALVPEGLFEGEEIELTAQQAKTKNSRDLLFKLIKAINYFCSFFTGTFFKC